MPKQIVILGGGYIAVEFAGIFAGLGSEVHLVYRADLPLRGFDEEASRRRVACPLCSQAFNSNFLCFRRMHVFRAIGRGCQVQRQGWRAPAGKRASRGVGRDVRGCWPRVAPPPAALQPAGWPSAPKIPAARAHPSPPPASPPAPTTQVRKFAAEQYEQNGIHLHPLTTPQQLEKLPDGRLKFTAAKRSGSQVGRTPAPRNARGSRTRAPPACLPVLRTTSLWKRATPTPYSTCHNLFHCLPYPPQSSEEETFAIECDHVLAATGGCKPSPGSHPWPALSECRFLGDCVVGWARQTQAKGQYGGLQASLGQGKS